MKKIIIISFLNCFICFSQEQIVKVTYKIGKTESVNTNSNISLEKKIYLENVNSYLKSLECHLIFNKTYSIFKLVEKMNIDDKNFAYNKARSFADGIFYKNNVDSVKIIQKEVDGKKYNIRSNFNEYNWQLTNETKVIDGYLCYKAFCKVEEFDKVRNKSLIFTPEVWYTPKIPYSYGPRGLDGLPGLVLEGKFGDRIYFYATKIEYNGEIIPVNLIKNQKIEMVSQDKYNDILKELTDRLLKP